MAESSAGSVRHLNTDAMFDAVKAYETAVDEYKDEVSSMKKKFRVDLDYR